MRIAYVRSVIRTNTSCRRSDASRIVTKPTNSGVPAELTGFERNRAWRDGEVCTALGRFVYDLGMALAQAELDDLWDFSDPSGSERRLRDAAETEDDAVARAELQTQVARALGLQERFEEADVVLGAVHASAPVVAVRVALERGRVRNSAGDPAAAAALFREAAEGAAAAGLDFLHVDSVHMLAIAEPDAAEYWTQRALEILEGVSDARTLRWRVSLHNNLGWALLGAGRRTDAIAAFERARDAAGRWGTAQQVDWADEALAEARATAAPSS